jgi:hypothetical protein
MEIQIACVVEGHGDASAVPILLRRLGQAIDPGLSIVVDRPMRVPKSKLVKSGELERAVEFSARKTSGLGAVLVVVDADDDCPATLGPELLSRARAARSDIPLSVVLAKREYEAWFLAAADSLRGKRGLPQDLAPPDDPESIRDAKGWLSRKMQRGQRYAETLDQPALTAIFDLAAARMADSFAKFCRDVDRLLRELQPPAQSA